ncbi:hypothetical protein [Nostoc sphaeroides]|uniref:hypothetical protein n=1 Tax=Nostoc sphaeroides TaxID=446679 RepID=UPI0018840DF9|nr:hypothetical protein [Nostoc sphaeroides]
MFQATLVAVTISPVERLISRTLFLLNCPNLFQLASDTEICFSLPLISFGIIALPLC